MIEKLYLVFGFFSFWGIVYLIQIGFEKLKLWYVKNKSKLWSGLDVYRSR